MSKIINGVGIKTYDDIVFEHHKMTDSTYASIIVVDTIKISGSIFLSIELDVSFLEERDDEFYFALVRTRDVNTGKILSEFIIKETTYANDEGIAYLEALLLSGTLLRNKNGSISLFSYNIKEFDDNLEDSIVDLKISTLNSTFSSFVSEEFLDITINGRLVHPYFDVSPRRYDEDTAYFYIEGDNYEIAMAKYNVTKKEYISSEGQRPSTPNPGRIKGSFVMGKQRLAIVCLDACMMIYDADTNVFIREEVYSNIVGREAHMEFPSETFLGGLSDYLISKDVGYSDYTIFNMKEQSGYAFYTLDITREKTTVISRLTQFDIASELNNSAEAIVNCVTPIGDKIYIPEFEQGRGPRYIITTSMLNAYAPTDDYNSREIIIISSHYDNRYFIVATYDFGATISYDFYDENDSIIDSGTKQSEDEFFLVLEIDPVYGKILNAMASLKTYVTYPLRYVIEETDFFDNAILDYDSDMLETPILFSSGFVSLAVGVDNETNNRGIISPFNILNIAADVSSGEVGDTICVKKDTRKWLATMSRYGHQLKDRQ